MSRKHTYRSVGVHQVSVAPLLAALTTPILIVALDVAKRVVLAAFADAAGQVARLVRFALPSELPALLDLLDGLTRAGRVVHLVLEPTGTYGDPIVAQADARGLAIFLVSPKRCHDAAELFDGVPSQHDPKDATILARLHAQGLSRRWTPPPVARRELRALVAERELYADPKERALGRLEALLARHWPELLQTVNVRTRPSVWRWLQTYAAPAAVHAAPTAARAALHAATRGKMPDARLDAVIAGAQVSQGVVPTVGERTLLVALLADIARLHAQVAVVERRLAAHFTTDGATAPLHAMLGTTTLAVLLAYVGDPRTYPSTGAFEKACGLNLTERSSGGHQSGLHVSKRGPGLVRKYLFLLALRQIPADPVAKAWYVRRQSYRAQHKLPAVVALTRKLLKAIWHVARGASYDPTKLFDVRRLDLTAAAPPAASTSTEEVCAMT